MADELSQKYEIEIARLDVLHAELDVLWEKVPRLGFAALLAPVVWYFSTLGWAITELFITGALVGTQAYLIGLRRSENRWNRAQIVADLELRRAELAELQQRAS